MQCFIYLFSNFVCRSRDPPAVQATNVRWWADTHVHALNSFVMLSDLFLNRMWHAPRHLAWVVGFGAYYAIFGVWAHWQYNEWAYAFLDPTKNHYWALTYIGISILFSLFFVLANYLVRARNSFAGSQRLVRLTCMHIDANGDVPRVSILPLSSAIA